MWPVVGAALSVGLLPGCTQPEDRPRPDVVLVLVDTLRADHMGAYGYPRDTTPCLDGLLHEAVLFEQVRAQAPCTFPSVNSLLTSRHTEVFLTQPEGEQGIPGGVPSIAEILAREGYATAAVSASPIVRATASDMNPSAGFGRGFSVFDERCLWRGAECVNRVAVELLEALREPCLLYLHYMDPHDPYRPPAVHVPRFGTDCDGPEFACAGDPAPIASMLYRDGPEVARTDASVRNLVRRYDEEIAYLDRNLGQLVDELRDRGRLDNTVLVVTSDHGEEFLEHGDIKHCRNLFDTTTRTPLILRVPGVAGGRRIAAPVSNLDVVPTILDYLGVDAAGLEMRGTSLRPLLEGSAAPPDLRYAGYGRWRSVDDGRFKLVWDGADLGVQLYDLRTDPGERHDLAGSSPEQVAQLGEALRQWLAATRPGDTAAEVLADSLAKHEELRALGYIE